MEFKCRITKTVTAIVTIEARNLSDAESKFESGDWDGEQDVDATVETNTPLEEVVE